MHSLIIDLFGPIFAKELVEMARRWRYYQNRILLGVVVLFVLFVAYEGNRYRWVGGNMLPQNMSKMAEIFFISYLWVQYLSVFFFVPFFLTGVIAGEREQKLLDLLFTTQLHDRDIIFGKLGSRVVSMLMLIISGIPIIAITMLMGGVNPRTLLLGMIGTMLALFCTSAVAIYMSTTTKSSIGALVRTYWWLLFWIVIVPAAIGLTTELLMYCFLDNETYVSMARFEYQRIGTTIIALLNPVTCFIAAQDVSLANHFAGKLGEWYFPLIMVISVLIGCLLVFFAIRNVRREPRTSKWMDRVRWVIGGLVNLLLLKPVTKRLLKRLPPSRTDKFLMFPVENPLWLRSRMAYVYDREQHIQRVQLAGWLLFAITFVTALILEPRFLNEEEASMIFLVWIWLGVGVLCCLVAGNSISSDRRHGFFEFVLVTPLTAQEVIRGTFLAVWRHVKLSYYLALVVTAIFMVFGKVELGNAITSVAIGSAFACLLVLQGIICSLVSRSVSIALVATFAFPSILLLGIPMLGSMFRQGVPVFLFSLTLVGVPLSFVMTMWRKNSFTIAFFLTFFHLGLSVFTSCWFYPFLSQRSEMPLMIINGGYLTIESLREVPYYYAHSYREVWGFAKIAYLCCMILSCAFFFRWVCWNYDVLSGRRERSTKSPLPSTSSVPSP